MNRILSFCIPLLLSIGLIGVPVRSVAAAPSIFAFACPAEDAIAVDGQATESVWQRAMPMTDLAAYIDNSRSADVQTIFKIAYDTTNLYIAVLADEPAMDTVIVEEADHDTWPPGSKIEVFLDPQRDRYTYYQLAANLAGTRYDSYRKDKDAWNPDWKAATRLGDKGWTMEMVIPLKDFCDAQPREGSVWGLNLCRNREGGLQNSSTWARVGYDFHNPGKFNSLIFGGPQDFIDSELAHGKWVSETTTQNLVKVPRFSAAIQRQLGRADQVRKNFAATSAAFAPGDLDSFRDIYVLAQSVRKCCDAIVQEMEVLLALSATQGRGDRK